MKRIFIIIASLVIASSLTGCSVQGNQSSANESVKSLTAVQIYQKAMSKQKNVKTADMDAEYKINMANQDGSNEILMNTNIKYDRTDNENLKMAVTGTMKLPTSDETTMSQIYIGNTIYIESSGMKIKSTVDTETAKSFMGDQDTEDMFGFNSFTEIKASDDGENTVLSFKCDAEQMNGFVKNIIEQYSGQTEGNYSLNEISGSFVVDKDYNLKTMNIKMNAVMEVSGNSMTMDLDINVILKSFGQPVDINAPADAESYIEVDPATLSAATTAAA